MYLPIYIELFHQIILCIKLKILKYKAVKYESVVSFFILFSLCSQKWTRYIYRYIRLYLILRYMCYEIDFSQSIKKERIRKPSSTFESMLQEIWFICYHSLIPNDRPRLQARLYSRNGLYVMCKTQAKKSSIPVALQNRAWVLSQGIYILA